MAERIETLDYYVTKALEFFEEMGDYTLKLPKSSYSLVVGSQTAYLAGRIIYRFAGRTFSHAKDVLAQYEIDTKKEILGDVTIVSAGGGRNIVPVAEYALKKRLRVNAVVCKSNCKLNRKFGAHKEYSKILVGVPKEPPTVNTVTYGRMIQGVTHENISEIKQAIESLKEPKGGYVQFGAFTVILPDSMVEVAGMVDWKLRGEKIGRCVGTTGVYLTNFMHGGGVTDAKKKKELYIALGLSRKEKRAFDQVLEKVPKKRKHYIDVPDDFGPLGYMMLGYSVVGQIQKNYPGFQKNIRDYERRAKKWKWLSPLCAKK